MRKAVFPFVLSFASVLRLWVLGLFLVGGLCPPMALADPFPTGHNCTPLQSLPAGEVEPVRLLLHWTPQAQFAGYIMAQEKGFFAEEGVPGVQLHWTNIGESPLSRLGNGEVEFAAAWLITGLQRRSEGLDIVNIGQFMQHSASLIVARKDRNIASLQDLNGKVILTWGGDCAMEFDLFLQRNSIKPAKILPLSDSLAPFLYGLVDATQAMEYSEYLRLLARGMKADEIVVFPFASYKVNLVGDGLYTTNAYLQKHRDIARGIRRAVERGWNYAFAHEDESVDAVIRYGDAWKSRSSKNYQRLMLRSMHKLMRSSGTDSRVMGHLARTDFDAAHVMAVESGLKVETITYENFFKNP